MLSWIFLIIAGICELGWPLGFKLSAIAHSNQNVAGTSLWIGFSLTAMLLSIFLLYQVTRHIPMGTAYVVWTGIGAVGTALIGIFLFNESADLIRLASLSMIIIGIMGLGFSHP